MTTTGMSEGIAALRRAQLIPTPQRVTVAGLVFSGPTLALTAGDIIDRARDADLTLSPSEAEEALGELRAAGVLPHMFESSRRSPLDVAGAARLLQAMANPHRLTVLRELVEGERTAGALGRATGLKPSALSQHLARLSADGVVNRRRAGSYIYYSLRAQAAKAVLRSLG